MIPIFATTAFNPRNLRNPRTTTTVL